MTTKDTQITSVSAINEFYNRVMLPAYNSCVYWNGHHPGADRMNISQLGPRTVTNPPVNAVQGQPVAAAALVNILRNHAVYTTVYRRARSGITRSGYDTGGDTLHDSIDVCRLLDNYQLNYGSINLNPGEVLSGQDYNNKLAMMRNSYAQAQNTAGVVDLRVCHDSCHDSCHSARGRR